MSDEFDLKHGSGNVFADFGDPDAEAKKLKAVIAAAIIATLDARGLSAREGAKVAKVDPADIQRIRNADLSRFTIDRLVRVASHLGCALEMKVLPRNSSTLVRYAFHQGPLLSGPDGCEELVDFGAQDFRLLRQFLR